MGYRMGGGSPAGIKTVAVAPIVNHTGEPALELQLAHALRQHIQFDGRLELANTEESADGVIEVALTQYDLQPIAYTDSDRSTPRLYRLRITGKAVLKRIATGTVVSSSETYGEALVPFQSDLTSSKRDALPEAAREFAKLAIDDLVEQW